MKQLIYKGVALLALLALGGSIFYGTHLLFVKDSADADEIETVSPAYDDAEFEKLTDSEIKLPGPLNKFFGPIALKKGKDKAGKTTFEATFPTKPIMLGQIGIDSGSMVIKGRSATFSIVVAFLGKKFKGALKKFTYTPAEKLSKDDLFPQKKESKEKRRLHVEECVFTLTPLADTDRFKLGDFAQVNSMELAFGESIDAALRLSVSIFGQEIIFSALVGEASQAEKAVEKSKDESDADASLVFRAELSKRKLSDLLPFIKGTDLDFLSYGGTTEFVLAGIQKAKKQEFMKKAKKVAVNKRAILRLAGNLSADGDSKIAKIFGLDFSELAATVDFMNLRAAVTGKTTILGLILKGKFLADISASPAELFFSAQLAAPINEWKPFEQIPGLKELESVRNTALSEVKVGVESSYKGAVEATTGGTAKVDSGQAVQDEDGFEVVATPVKDSKDAQWRLALYAGGKGNLLGVACQVTAKIQLNQAGVGLVLMANLPDGVKFSMIFPELFKTKSPVTEALDLLQLSKSYIVVATQRDPVLDVEQGLNFKTGIAVNGSSPILEILKVFRVKSDKNPQGPELKLSGYFDPLSPLNLKLKAGVSAGDFGLTIPGIGVFKGGALNVVVRGEPAIGVEGAFLFQPTPADIPLLFAGEITCSETDIGIIFSMRDLWKNPFGIPGFEIGNLGFRDTVTYQAITQAIATGGAAVGSLLVPGKFGLAGEVKIGTTKPLGLKLFFILGTDVKNTFIDAKVENITTIFDFVRAIFEQFKVESPIDLLAKLIPPTVLDYAWLKFAPGGASLGNLVINAGVGGGFGMLMLGVPLKIIFSVDTKGLYGEGTLGKIDLGPLKIMGATGGDSVVRLAAHLEKGLEFVVDSRVALLDVFESLARIQLSTKGLAFETDFALGPKEMGMNMHVKATTIDFTDPAQALKALAPEQLKLTIQFSQSFTDQLKRTIDTELTKARDQLQLDMNNTIEQIGRKAIDQDLANQQSIVNQKNAVRFPYPWWPPLRIFEWIRAEAEFTAESLKMALLQAKAAIERTFLGQFMRDTMDKLGITQFLQNTLKTIRDLGIGALEGGRFVFNNMSNIAVIKNVYWSGSLADVKSGVLPGILVTLSIQGKEETRNMGPFNLKDPVASINGVTQSVVALARDMLLTSLPR